MGDYLRFLPLKLKKWLFLAFSSFCICNRNDLYAGCISHSVFCMSVQFDCDTVFGASRNNICLNSPFSLMSCTLGLRNPISCRNLHKVNISPTLSGRIVALLITIPNLPGIEEMSSRRLSAEQVKSTL
mgnify:CR=1 FL=1